MGIGDKFEAKKDQVVGGAKEGIGDATDNERLQGEGAGQKAQGNAQGAWEKVKDTAEGIKDSFKK